MEMASISTGNAWTRFKGSSASRSATEEVLSREVTHERSRSALDLYLNPNRIAEFGFV